MMNRLLFLTMLLLISLFPSKADSFLLQQSGGWFETAWVKWTPLDGADRYNVYYTGEGVTNKKIDDPLIRSYGSYFRADIPGLKAGSYTITVAAVVGGVEIATLATEQIAVAAHDRTGFAFQNQRVPGAYKADGTPKANAVVIYVTEQTKNSVSLDVVTGKSTTSCVGLQTILDGFKKGNDTRPLIVRMIGQITDLSYMLNGDVVIENGNNSSSYITLEGIGSDAVADGWGIRIKNASNIEIRNIGTMNCNSGEGDNIGLQQDNDYIWVHHCDFFYGDAGGDADQAKGDGALDCKKSTYVTFSYNHFWDTGKSNLLGLSETAGGNWYITYHHNWYDHSDSRHPRVRFYSAHVYNNYYDGNSKYGVGATEGSSVFVEGNYFRNCKYPMMISMQGSDVYNTTTQANDYKEMPTFSKEDGGNIKAYDNYMTGQRRFAPYGDPEYPNASVDFDAYVVASRAETVPAAVKAYQGAAIYNNFDTNSTLMYSCQPDSPEEARDNVIAFAGRLDGGDFKWTFDNSVDDNSYAVNTGLKAALVGYQTSLVAIQGDAGSTTPDPDPDPDPEPNPEPTPGDMIHNFTLSGKTSTFYTITGNLAKDKGTVEYQGLTLTQCLKMESSTSIKFTLSQPATLTLVFNTDFNKNVKIDGKYTVANGILSIVLPAGEHEIQKGDTTNLYYMSIAFATGIDDTMVNQPLVYPNPAVATINISGDSEVRTIEIYSLGGALLKRVDNSSQTDVSHLKPGLYLVVVTTEQGVFKYKIRKQ